MNWRKQRLASSSTASTTGHDGRTDTKINLDRENEKRNATCSRRPRREWMICSWGLYRGGSGGSSSQEREEWPAVDLRLSDFFSVWVILRHQNIPPPLLSLYSSSLSLFLSLLIPLFCSIHFTLSSLVTLLMRVSSVFMTIIVRC